MSQFWDGFTKRAEMKQVSTVALINIGKRTLLMGKRRDNQKWTTPGGHLEPGERPLAGAIREVREESGVELGEDDLIHLKSETVTKPGGEKLKIHAYKSFFGSDDLPKTTVKYDPDDEVYSWKWVPMSGGLPKDIEDNLHVPLGENVLLKGLNLSEPDERLPAGEGLRKAAFWQAFHNASSF